MRIRCHKLSQWQQLVVITACLTIVGERGVETRQDAGCGPGVDAVLQRAAADAAAADGDAAARALHEAHARNASCAALGVASWSWRGWAAAAQATTAGGTDDVLAGVREALDALEPGGRAGSPDAVYAAAILHAAAAAAQHERAEMRVWLEHAAGLAARLMPGTRPWPLPPDIAEGELWLAVDDHEMAEKAFARALAAGHSPVALRGLARARARRGDMAGACAPFRRALELVQAERPEGPLAVEARAFLPLCR